MEIDVSLLLSSKKRDMKDITKKHSHYIWTATGRSAIYHALEELEGRGIERIAYLPAYVCDSVIQPFKKKKYTIHFYSMGADLKTPANLPEDLNNVVFLFVHYFGHENKSMSNWLRLKKLEQRFYVIEDCVQAAFSDIYSEWSDFRIYSYRKFTPQPDGALLISNKNIQINLFPNFDNMEFLLDQIEGKIRRSLSMKDTDYLPLLKHSEARLDNIISLNGISDFSTFLMERIDFEEIKSVRRRNWFLLKELIEQDVHISSFLNVIFETISSYEVPLGFPVLVSGGFRNDLRQFLIRHNIFCPIHWNISDSTFKEDLNVSLNILTLPIDQRMNEDHVYYLVRYISQFFLEVSK
ncbi:hypothetical protein AB4Z50_01220 [Paenibacillus sp. 2TAB26]|uniref:hypothetical protein n=1 Tax=Paenibacillus sp. 2TAB26 TaxID=3233005 RepID=UPI003F94E03A